MPVYECRFKVDAIRRRLIEAPDEDSAAEQAEDLLREVMGLERSELDLIDLHESKREDE